MQFLLTPEYEEYVQKKMKERNVIELENIEKLEEDLLNDLPSINFQDFNPSSQQEEPQLSEHSEVSEYLMTGSDCSVEEEDHNYQWLDEHEAANIDLGMNN